VLKGEEVESNEVCGKRGIEPLPPDAIVSKPHYLHSLVRGVYKPANDPFVLSIYTNPESKWGQEVVILSPDRWTLSYDFGPEYKHPEDIEALRKCAKEAVPFGVITRVEKSRNLILGLGEIVKVKDNCFSVAPIDLDVNTASEIDNVAYDLVSKQAEKRDYSSLGTLRTVLGRQKMKWFRDQLLHEYDGKCAFCGLSIESLLVASHIVPVATMRKEDPSNVMNPSNGLLLCRLCDKAFEDGDVQVTEKGSINIASKLTSTTSDPALHSWRSCINRQIPMKQNSTFRAADQYLHRKIQLINQ
jgi:hypothetical protein